MPARDLGKPDGYYCDGTRHKADCTDKANCPGCAPPCSARAGAGTSHVGVGRCSRHLGATRNHVKAAEKELAMQAVERYGLPVDIDPATAMMQMVAHSYGQVLYMRAKVDALDEPWVEDRPHVAWVMLKAEEKQHLDVCRDAVKAGATRRVIELMEDEARRFVAFANLFARLMGWDPAAEEVLKAGRRAFEALEPGNGQALEGTAVELGG